MALEERIFFVDDDPNILEAYQRKLHKVVNLHTAAGPVTGLDVIKEKGPFAVVVADMNMPVMNGIDFLKEVQEIAPETVRIMLTGNADIKVAMQAVNSGSVFRFLTKPCPPQLMGDSLLAAISQYRLVSAEKELIEGTLKGAVDLLTEILSWVTPDTFGRTAHVRSLVKGVAVKLEPRQEWEIEMAATLAQIGQVAIPSETHAKISAGEALDENEERALLDTPAVGYELLKRIPRLGGVAQIVLYQNKHFDGSGYPADTVAGEDIPLGARILKAASDVCELHASGKSARESMTDMQVRRGWYDPRVLAAIGTFARTQEAQTEQRRVVALPLRALRAGQTLVSGVVTLEGRKLVAGGTVFTEALLLRLKKFRQIGSIKEPISVRIESECVEEDDSLDMETRPAEAKQ